eukprot:4235763-Amphidinium_carterae.1
MCTCTLGSKLSSEDTPRNSKTSQEASDSCAASIFVDKRIWNQASRAPWETLRNCMQMEEFVV